MAAQQTTAGASRPSTAAGACLAVARAGVVDRAGRLAALTSPAVICAVAAALLSLSLTVSAGLFGRRSLVLVTAAAVLAIVAARRRGATSAWLATAARSMTEILLAVIVAASLVTHLIHSPGPENIPPRPLGFVLLAAVALLVLVSFAPAFEERLRAGGVPVETLRIGIWIACAAGMGIAVYRSVPAPFIDVWTFQQEAAATLLRGRDPYAHLYTNVFGNLAFFSPAIANDHWVWAFPYPPLTILLGLPAYLLGGDTRYAPLAALLVGAWAITRLAPGRAGTLAAGAVLFHPRTFHVLDRAWTEPTVLAAVLLAALVLARPTGNRRNRWIAAGLAGAILLASKQYAVLFALPLLVLVPRRTRVPVIAVAATACALVFVPFAVWDFGSFWRGVVAMQVVQPFRSDSLAWPAALVQLAGASPLPAWIGFAACLAALALAWPRRRTPGAAVLCGVAGFLWFLLLGKQAFLNYYWLANALLFTVSAVMAGGDRWVTAEVGADDRRQAGLRRDARVQRG